MRIDEFKASPSGAITAEDRTRFSCFGFDITSATPVGGINKIIAALRLWKQLHEGED